MYDNPKGTEAGKLVLENIYSRFKRLYDIYDNILEDKIKILEWKEPIFICYEDYSFFKDNFLLIAGEEDFNYYESEFLLKTIDELKFHFFNSDFIYNIDNIEGFNLIKVSVVIKDIIYPIVYINPYFKIIESVPNEYAFKLKEDIQIYKKEIAKLNNKEKETQVKIKNPLFSAENPLDMIQIAIKKKKKIEQLKHLSVEINNTIMDYNYKINESENLLKEVYMELSYSKEDKALLINKLTKSFNYEFINNKEDELQEYSLIEKSKKEGLRELNKRQDLGYDNEQLDL